MDKIVNGKGQKNKKSVGVIGGGAAGMMAAITAARNGAEVTILEAGERLGQKILSTGNGKCNLGNLDLNASKYYGSCEFLEECFASFGAKETIAFFEGIGLLVKDKNGYLYPRCEQASAVLDALRFAVNGYGIKVKTCFRVKEVRKDKNGKWFVAGEAGRESFDVVILTCGGKAMPKTGSDGSGYDLAKSLGHSVEAVVPALTALKCKGDFFKAISGVRTEAEIALFDANGKCLGSDRGELQLTDYGISGIPTFQVSRMASKELYKRREVKAVIDFLPWMPAGDAIDRLAEERMKLREGRSAEECMTGILPKKIMALLLKRAGISANQEAKMLTKEKVIALLQDAKRFALTVVGTGDFSNCQVCAGGVNCHEITKGMESKKHENLYFAGEILDVDGICGGYNLQWAWTSGFLAGTAAGR